MDGSEYPENVNDSQFWRGDVVKITVTSDGDYGNAPTMFGQVRIIGALQWVC